MGGTGLGLVGLTWGRAEWPCRAAANTLHAQRGEGEGGHTRQLAARPVGRRVPGTRGGVMRQGTLGQSPAGLFLVGWCGKGQDGVGPQLLAVTAEHLGEAQVAGHTASASIGTHMSNHTHTRGRWLCVAKAYQSMNLLLYCGEGPLRCAMARGVADLRKSRR